MGINLLISIHQGATIYSKSASTVIAQLSGNEEYTRNLLNEIINIKPKINFGIQTIKNYCKKENSDYHKIIEIWCALCRYGNLDIFDYNYDATNNYIALATSDNQLSKIIGENLLESIANKKDAKIQAEKLINVATSTIYIDKAQLFINTIRWVTTKAVV
jgi:hypothetical protein